MLLFSGLSKCLVLWIAAKFEMALPRSESETEMLNSSTESGTAKLQSVMLVTAEQSFFSISNIIRLLSRLD
jgi:hypothetical protein